MTETIPVEDRLRRAFQAVADQPVPVLVLDSGRPTGHFPSPSRRRTGLLVGAAVVAVAAIGSVAVVYGPRSSPPGSPPLGGGQSGAMAVFRPTDPTVTKEQLSADARVLTRRLASLGDGAARAQVRGRSVVITGGGRLPVSARALATRGTVTFRPALCAGAPYTSEPSLPPPNGDANIGRQFVRKVPGACSSPEYSLEEPNLLIGTGTGTSNIASIPLDPTLTAVPTSTPGYDDSQPGDPVLVPLVGGGGERYLLGPAELNGRGVARAKAVHQGAAWVVDIAFTSQGAARWDELAQKYFHEIIGFDLDGQVMSAPITEPNQSSFTSFDGKVGISGNFTRESARELAAVLNSGPLETPLTDGAPKKEPPPSTTAPPVVSTTGTPSELPGVVAECTSPSPHGGDSTVKPSSITLACGDGGTGVESLVWTSWTETGASATGELWENNCIPDCAEGTMEVYPASLTLFDVVTTTSGSVFSQMNTVYRPRGPQGQSTEHFTLPLP